MISSPVKKIVVNLLRDYANKIENGNSNLSIDEATNLIEVLSHIALSKEEACQHLNIRRSRFDDLVREGKIPRGVKLKGRKELVWYKDELDNVVKD